MSDQNPVQTDKRKYATSFSVTLEVLAMISTLTEKLGVSRNVIIANAIEAYYNAKVDQP